jgi:osmotically-inducible protein OsmY
MPTLLYRHTARTLLALAAAPLLLLGSLSATAGTTDSALESAVESALSSSMGKDAKDLSATVHNGNVTLHGWTQRPRQESEARAVASRVAGVGSVYSHIRVFSSRD